MDNHIGLVYTHVHLDDIAPTLVENGVGFRAFRDMYASDPLCMDAAHAELCGSIWTTGHSALGIEMHSFFSEDLTFFNGDFQPTYLDFCNAADGTGDASFGDDLGVF